MKLHEIGMPDNLLEQALSDLNLPSDWRYRDMPKTTKENYDLAFELIGAENYHVITEAKYEHHAEGMLYRSQFFISPQGIKNLQAYVNQH